MSAGRRPRSALPTYRVDQHVAAIDPFVLGWIRQQRGTSGGKVRKVKTGTRQVVLGLSDIHPEALKIVGVQLMIGSDSGEDLLFYRRWSKLLVPESISFPSSPSSSRRVTHLNSVQHTGVEHVDTGVDSVANEFDGLLYETIDDGGSRLGHDNTVCRRLRDFGHHN